jgi:putative ABC transport system permease protein
MSSIIHDLRCGIRMFSRRPGFTVVAVMAIALGISSTTAVFSLVHSVLLSSLPLDHLDRLVMLWQQDLTSGRDRITLSPAEYRAYADGQTAFDSLAAMRGVSLNANLGDAPTAVDGLQVTPNFFATLGI